MWEGLSAAGQSPLMVQVEGKARTLTVQGQPALASGIASLHLLEAPWVYCQVEFAQLGPAIVLHKHAQPCQTCHSLAPLGRAPLLQRQLLPFCVHPNSKGISEHPLYDKGKLRREPQQGCRRRPAEI